MKIRIPQSFGPACALAMIAGAAASAQSVRGTVELIPHSERAGAVLRAERDCLVLRAGVVRTSEMGACVETLAATERRMVLQLDGPLTKDRAERLASAGVRLGQYLPTNAFIAETDGIDAAAFGALDFVRWHGAFDKSWKLAAEPEQREFVTELRQRIADRGEALMVLSLFEGADAEATVRALKETPGMFVVETGELGGNPIITVVVPVGQVSMLTDLRDVMAIEEAPEATPRMATSGWVVQSNVNGYFPLHDNGLDGTGQIIGVMDLPVDEDHCVFDDSEPIGPTHRKWVAINSNSGTSSHGTYVCSMIAGDNGAAGDLRGVAYKARMAFSLIPSFSEAALISRFELHHSQGARIHSNSWGDDNSSRNFYNVWSRAIDVFTHDHEDDLVVFAATNLSTLRTPENSRNVLAAGASWDTPLQTDHRSGGIGPTSDGRRKPELYAPGSGVRAATQGSCSASSSGVGTSFAAPQLSGAAALARQYYMEGYYPTGAPVPGDGFTPSGALLKATLLNSAVDMTGEPGYPADLEGWGRVLMDEALHFSGESRTMMVNDVRNTSPEALTIGATGEMEFEVSSSAEKLKVTLVFTDIEAAPAAALVAVNDLNLEVESPSGTVYLGNVFSGGLSVAGGSPDALNNVEQVHLTGPETGVWTVRVFGASVNTPAQGYSVVVSGAVGAAVAACPADLDGNGTVDGADLADLLAGWGSVNLSADLDSSGTVDGTDLAVLLASWGPCP